jgi:hypothetical protein
LEALSTLTPVRSSLIETSGVEATGIILALVQGPTVGVGIASGSWRTLAEKASVLVDALGSGAARVAQTFIEVDTPCVRVSSVALLTGAGVVPRRVVTKGVCSTSVGLSTLINVSTLHLSVALEARLALADVLGWEVAALRVVHTLPG